MYLKKGLDVRAVLLRKKMLNYSFVKEENAELLFFYIYRSLF